MTTFMTEGRTSIPAFLIEITKGDAAVFALPELLKRMGVNNCYVKRFRKNNEAFFSWARA
jgi:hypothetical protein